MTTKKKKEASNVFNVDYKELYEKFWTLYTEREEAMLQCLSLAENCKNADTETRAAAFHVILHLLVESEIRLADIHRGVNNDND